MDYDEEFGSAKTTFELAKRTLISPAGAHADVPHVAGLNNVVEGLHLVIHTYELRGNVSVGHPPY